MKDQPIPFSSCAYTESPRKRARPMASSRVSDRCISTSMRRRVAETGDEEVRLLALRNIVAAGQKDQELVLIVRHRSGAAKVYQLA